MTTVLNRQEMEHFVEKGYVMVRQSFSREAAEAVVCFMWDRLGERGIFRDAPSTWTHNRVYFQEKYDATVFLPCATERLIGSTEEVVGAGRWKKHLHRNPWGHWAINFFKGSDREWDVPKSGWHWDGMDFNHHLNSPDQGSVQLCLFTDVGHHSGGTFIAEGTHRLVAQFLSRYPDGLAREEALSRCKSCHPWLAALTGNPLTTQREGILDYGRIEVENPTSRVEVFMRQPYVDSLGNKLQVIETTGEAGDMILCHPLLMHAPSYNHSEKPRFLCNRPTPLYQPMSYSRADGNYSPVEWSTRLALQAMITK